MTEQTLERAICAYISNDLLGGMEVQPEDELLLSDLIDSMGVVRLVAHLEDSLDITIPPEDVILDTMQNVRAIATYLHQTHGVTEMAAA